MKQIDALINRAKGMGMGRVVSATEARIRFGEVMREAVESGEPVIVEREGTPHVVVLSMGEYQRLLRVQQPHEDWRTLVNQARARVQADLEGRELPPTEDVLRQIREERDAQLMALH
jgi:prevent-host-death family protein